MSISSSRENCLEVQNLKKYFELKAGFFKKPNILKAVDDVSFPLQKASLWDWLASLAVERLPLDVPC